MPTTRAHGTGSLRRRAGTALLALTATACGFTLTACQNSATAPGERPASSAAAPSGATGSPAPSPAASPEWDTSPDSLAAVGDSITAGFDACGPLAVCPRASWATGTDPSVDSLARRLLDHPARDSRNYAEPGATMADLPGQMARAAARSPALVTVLVGANDACRPSATSMTPVAAFRADFADALRSLWRKAPRAQAYVAGIPDLKHLWRVGRKQPQARRVWALGVCPSMLRAPRATGAAAEARRERVAERVRAYNAALREVCSAERRCRWDGGAVHRFRFTAASLSRWDWFHPSRKGQSALARLAHARITDR
ncbi:SGNH/GDSL hydrolase family protein [Streptomyces sp. TR06-5]|uniref:SGNH/GDSL hydrolase family protein n=1 Tax=unclassified Streptomyces TaxID=2593676 RepID=UPI0039A38FDA